MKNETTQSQHTQGGKLKIGHNSGKLCVDTEDGSTFCTANKPEYAQRIVKAVNMHDELTYVLYELNSAVKNYFTYNKRESIDEKRIELWKDKAEQLLKQAEQK